MLILNKLNYELLAGKFLYAEIATIVTTGNTNTEDVLVISKIDLFTSHVSQRKTSIIFSNINNKLKKAYM